MFPCLPNSGNTVAETKFASHEAKMFLRKFRNIYVEETMFPSLTTCFEVFPARETVFPIRHVKTLFQDDSVSTNNT